MASSYSTNLALTLPVQGELSGTWGTAVNTGITNMVDEALGYQAYSATGGSDTLTIPDGATGVARSIYIQLNGTGGGTVNVPTTKTKMYFVFNNTASAITFKVTGQTGVSIPAAGKMALVSNGTDIIVAQNYFSALTLGAGLPPASGGTGVANNAAMTVTGSGNFAYTRTLTGTTNVTFPTTGTLATLAGSETLTNKTINGSNNTVTNISLTSGVTGVLPTANGGTNLSGATPFTSGGVLYASSASALASSAALTANNVVVGGGAGAAPSSTNLLAISAAVTTGNYIKAIGYADTVTVLGNTGTAINLDVTSGGVFTATLNGSATITLRYPVATGASSFILILTNDATPGRTVAFAGGTFKYPGGSVTRTTTANAIDIWFFFTPNGGTTYYASIPMANLS